MHRVIATNQGGIDADVLDLIAAIVAASLFALTSLNVGGAPRVLLTLGFSIFVPGRAIVTNWPEMSQWAGATMSMVFSLTVIALVTTVSLWIGYWHPVGLFQAGVIVCTVGLGVGAMRRRRRARYAVASEVLSEH